MSNYKRTGPWKVFLGKLHCGAGGRRAQQTRQSDRSGIIHWEIISNGIRYWWNDDDERQLWRIPDKNGKRQLNINSDVYLALLDRIHVAIETKRPRKKNHIVFHHDNA
ncbi:hypothetical protein ACJJTC_015104 [Scirpophaga incertulas]